MLWSLAAGDNAPCLTIAFVTSRPTTNKNTTACKSFPIASVPFGLHALEATVTEFLVAIDKLSDNVKSELQKFCGIYRHSLQPYFSTQNFKNHSTVYKTIDVCYGPQQSTILV